MGYRTVVILYNDQQHEWQKDTQLGERIAHAASVVGFNLASANGGNLGYGQIAECVHADVQTLAVIDSYNMRPLVHSRWRPNETNEELQLRLLREYAASLGYHVVKNPLPKRTR